MLRLVPPGMGQVNGKRCAQFALRLVLNRKMRLCNLGGFIPTLVYAFLRMFDCKGVLSFGHVHIYSQLFLNRFTNQRMRIACVVRHFRPSGLCRLDIS